MIKQYKYRVREISAIPRTGREIDAIKRQSFVGGSGGSSGPTYWKLIATDEAGEPLAEGQEYIHADHSAHTAGSFLAAGDVVAHASGKWDFTKPLAGYDAVGLARFSQEHFIVENGLVSLIKGAGSEGVNFTPGAGLVLTPGEPDVLSVKFGAGKGYALEGTAKFWGQTGTVDPTTKLFTVKGAMTGVGSIDNRIFFNSDGTVDIAKDLNDVHIRLSGGNSINGATGENATLGNLYLNYADATHYVKIDDAQNILTTGNMVAYAAGKWDFTEPIAGTNALGMIKVGSGLQINDGVLSVAGASGGTIGGITLSGSGNVLTGVALSDDKSVLTFTKGLTAWHAGNDGAGSGLDADLLDGQQGAYYRRNSGDVNSVEFTVGGDADTYYPVVFNTRASFGRAFPWARFSVSRIFSAPAPDTWNTPTHRGGLTLCWDCTTDHYWGGNSPSNFRIVQLLESYSKMVYDIGITTNGMVVYLRGGGAKYWYSSPAGIGGQVTVYLQTFTDSASRSFEPKTGTPTLADLSTHFPLRNIKDFYGSLVGNASTATALQTSRTLWGQPFNGTGNVQGNITGAGNILPLSDNTYSIGSASNRFLALHTGFIELYASTPAIDFHYGRSTADYTSRIIESASGRLQIVGKLAIGYTNDTYALAASTFVCDSWVRTNGATGWYSQTYAGGIYMADTTYVRTYGRKRFYVDDTSGDSIRTAGAFNRVAYAGASWNNGFGALGVQIVNNVSQTPLIVGYRSSVTDTGANRVFALELLNSGSVARMCFGGAHKFEFYSSGNLLATGNVVAYAAGAWDLTKPIAGPNALGMIKVGGGLQITADGVLSATGSSGGGGSVAWSAITGKPSWIGSSKPTYAWSEISSKPSWIGSSKPSYSWSEISGKPSILSSITYSVSGSGNAVTNVTASGNTVYVTKGTISGSSGLGTWAYLPSGGTVFTTSGNGLGVKLSGGNAVNGWNTNSGIMGNLYLNYVSGSTYVVVDTAGNGKYTGSWTKVSDMRLKKKIEGLSGVLRNLPRLDIFYYHANNDPMAKRQLGVSAQQLLPLYPEIVVCDENGYYGVDYSNLSVVALQGVKELLEKQTLFEREQREIKSRLHSRRHWEMTKDQQIRLLMKENDLLKARVAELEGRAA